MSIELHCKECSEPFNASPNDVKRGRAYCSRSCSATAINRIQRHKFAKPRRIDHSAHIVTYGTWSYKLSPEDFEWSLKTYWRPVKGYAQGEICGNAVLLHRAVMERKLGRSLNRKEYIDHINNDHSDNRRENLRLATPSQNTYNRGPSSASGYKGVMQRKYSWSATIFYCYARVTVQGIPTALEAAYIYDQLAMQLHGEFAYLNVL